MSIRVDSNQLVAGKTVVSLYAGHGVQAQNIPSTGDSGASFLYNDIASQGMSPTDEVRGEILTLPSAGVLIPNEDGSFTFSGAPDGVYTFTYRGFRNGVTYGDFTVTLVVGGEVAVIESIVKNTYSTSTKTLALETGLAVPLSNSNIVVNNKSVTLSLGQTGSIIKNGFSYSGKLLTVVTGNEVPMVISLNKSSLTYESKLLDVVTGTNVPVSVSLNKTRYTLYNKSLTLQIGNDLAINKEGLTISYKDFFIPPTGYPVFDSSRVFYIKKSKQTTFYI